MARLRSGRCAGHQRRGRPFGYDAATGASALCYLAASGLCLLGVVGRTGGRPAGRLFAFAAGGYALAVAAWFAAWRAWPREPASEGFSREHVALSALPALAGALVAWGEHHRGQPGTSR